MPFKFVVALLRISDPIASRMRALLSCICLAIGPRHSRTQNRNLIFIYPPPLSEPFEEHLPQSHSIASFSSKMSDNPKAADIKTYLVTLKDDATTDETDYFIQSINELGGKVTDELDCIKGYTIKMLEPVAEFLKEHNTVSSIEEDQEVKIQQ